MGVKQRFLDGCRVKDNILFKEKDVYGEEWTVEEIYIVCKNGMVKAEGFGKNKEKAIQYLKDTLENIKKLRNKG